MNPKIEWSEDDKCYIGTCPDLFLGGVHGDDPEAVRAELLQVIEELSPHYKTENGVVLVKVKGEDWKPLVGI